MVPRRGQLPQAVREAAERLVAGLVDDEALAAHVAEQRIDAEIAAGRLVPIEKLTVVGGLVLAPAGRIGELEQAVAAAIAALSGDKSSVDDALLVLHKATAPSGSDQTPDTPAEAEREPEPEPEADPEPVKPKGKMGGKRGPKPVEVEVDSTGRPVEMPDPSVDHPCEDCGEMVPGDEASLVWTRFRRVICQSCLG